jgi:hypothetical protein
MVLAMVRAAGAAGMNLILAILLAYAVVAAALCARLYYSRPCRGGHAWQRHDTPTRIYLRCDVCGHESPGWNLFGVPPGCERLEPRRQ